MPESPRRLAEIVQVMLADRGWRSGPSVPDPGPSGKDASQLVFVGNWQDPCPRRLLFDPELEPVDIVTWQVIRVHADASRLVAFPSYEQLMRSIKVARATVARALAVLRLTRWLPLCAALRDPQGRFAGHVYALNDEPLPLAEMLEIDAAYVAFVDQARKHRSAHVRRIASLAFEGIQQQCASMDPETLSPVRLGDQVGERLANLLGLLRSAPSPSPSLLHRVQNLNAVRPVQNLNAVRSSSSFSEKETTTTRVRMQKRKRALPPADDDAASLVFPAELSLTDSQRRVLALRLDEVPGDLRQDILDEGAGRILKKRSTTDPVRCEFDYLARLCVRAIEGQFVFTDAGEGLRRKRVERAGADERLRRAKAHSEARRLREIEAFQASVERGKSSESDEAAEK